MPQLLETIKVIDGKCYNLDYHQARMNRSIQEFYQQTAPSLEEDLSDQDIPKAGFYKCRVIYEKNIEEVQFVPYTIATLTSLQVVHVKELDYHVKYLDRGALNKLREQKGDCDDIFIVCNGKLTDTSYANIILWNGEEWHTPDTPLLKGTKREQLLQEGVIKEISISIDDLNKYQKVSLINAMMNPGDIEIPIDRIKK
ncbi:4-amino-4-deoxychorismate lyase [Puteibacter caeruleilacunae]|nr:4-amino-4-deoxychorismate lyase [Puteibacter caeruleilacunae]